MQSKNNKNANLAQCRTNEANGQTDEIHVASTGRKSKRPSSYKNLVAILFRLSKGYRLAKNRKNDQKSKILNKTKLTFTESTFFGLTF